MQDSTILSVSNLKVKFDNHVILKGIDFEVKENETLAVIGPNGAGKTVLFRALLGLIPYSGKITWKPGVKIGYVPQKLAIAKDLPLTTEEFFQLKERDKNEVARVLATVGFEEDKPHEGHLTEHVLKRKIGALSGGEQQRVLIAFALLGSPRVLLFDEPTSGVDISSEESIYLLLHKLQKSQKLTIILISHELQVVNHYATKVLCLNKERLCYGSPSQVLDKEKLEQVYGGSVGFYHHQHEHHQ